MAYTEEAKFRTYSIEWAVQDTTKRLTIRSRWRDGDSLAVITKYGDYPASNDPGATITEVMLDIVDAADALSA